MTLSCQERVDDNLKRELENLKKLWDAQGQYIEDLGSLDEYVLGFDFVELDTFTDQTRAYWRLQLSWGGPADEFRAYVKDNYKIAEIIDIEYWFLDWWDGAFLTLVNEDFDLLLEIFKYFMGI
jgi:hypothetical protein